MVLTKWIVPEPNPDLKLSIDTIDYKKLDYEDLRWIYSSTMKKYYREFCNLKGFVQYAERIFDLELLRRNSVNSHVNSHVNGYLTPKLNESVRISSAKPPLYKSPLYKSPPLYKPPPLHKLPPPVEPPPTLSYDRNIILNTQKVLPTRKIPFIGDTKRIKDYENTIDKYCPRSSNKSKEQKSSEACIIC